MSAGLIQILFFLAFVIPGIIYVVSLYSTISKIKPENQAMKPWMMWLLFIPLFNVVFHLYTVSKLSTSISREILSHGEELKAFRPTYGIGMMCSIAVIISTTISLLGLRIYTPFQLFSGMSSLTGMICWIIYWIKVTQYKSTISRLQARNN